MIVQENQTLFDIALQEFGSAEAAFAIARTNNISLTDIIPVGTEITLPDFSNPSPAVNRQMLAYYKNHNIQPATGTNDKFIQVLGRKDIAYRRIFVATTTRTNININVAIMINVNSFQRIS